MSAIRKSLFAVALLLGMAVAGAAPASAQTPRGIWVKIDALRAWTLTVINLTDYPLELTNNVVASKAQRPPFNGNTLDDAAAFPLAPYQNVTWKSNTATLLYPNSSWDGALSVLPQGKDPKWRVTLNFSEYWYETCEAKGCNAVGTWVYMTADASANPDWVDDDPYNISCNYPSTYNGTYNIMTLSGTDLVASLYAPHVDSVGAPSVDITLIIRQRWSHTELENGLGYQDAIAAPCLTFQDNDGIWYLPVSMSPQ